MGAGGAFAGGQALSLFGGALEAKGLQEQASAASLRGDYQAGVLRQTAAFNREAAADVIKRGRVMQQRQQTATSQFIGRQRAALAANGIVVDEGSAVDLVRDTVRTGRQSELDIKFAAERQALQFEIDAVNAESDATLAALTGGQQARALRTASITTLLGAGGKSAASSAIYANA
jgi:hypothetical protein